MVEVGMKTNNENAFLNTNELINQLSIQISNNLKKAIKSNGKASLLVSGGTTPKALFKKLSTIDLAWDKVKIGLCDERWINTKHKDSNEKLIEDYLLQEFAKDAKFISMYHEYIDIQKAQSICSDIYKKELFPFDVLVLGMGLDGHTASLFPNNEKLEYEYNIDDNICISMTPNDAPYDRMSLTKEAILSAKNIYLHFEGEEKIKVYQKALNEQNKNKMPIALILNSTRKVEVYYT
jgi:6-phosphogluconolactonase